MNIRPSIKYKIKASKNTYSTVTEKCRLCLLEKLEILLADEKKYMFDRSEYPEKCCHANKYMLSGVWQSTEMPTNNNNLI